MTSVLLALKELVVLKVIVSQTGKEPAALTDRLQVGVRTPGVIKFGIEKEEQSTTETWSKKLVICKV